MLLTEYKFFPKTGTSREALEDASYGLAAALSRNGQLWGQKTFGWVDGALVLSCLVPRSNSLAAEYDSHSVRHELGLMIALCSQIPRWRVVDDRAIEADTAETDWPSSGLYLFTHAFKESSPVCRADDGAAVPLYLLPIEQVDREGLFWWMRMYRHLDQVWLDSGHLEVPAYRQLADPKSDFSMRGRKLAKTVETATGLPTYYYLLRYWGRRAGEARRRCPGCGGKWAVTATTDKGLNKHELRCEPCRLISRVADDWSEPSRAVIGEWRGARTPTPKKSVKGRINE
jgi:predicted  nucleic acid-binding Zn ribbon protein